MIELVNPFKDSAAAAAEIYDEVKAGLPAEKAMVAEQLKQTGKEIAAMNGQVDKVDGRGMACLSIPPLVYQRWHHMYPGAWKDQEFVAEFAADNPECVLPGYRPKAKTMYFDMGHAAKPSYGANIYHEKKLIVRAEIEAAQKFVDSFKL